LEKGEKDLLMAGTGNSLRCFLEGKRRRGGKKGTERSPLQLKRKRRKWSIFQKGREKRKKHSEKVEKGEKSALKGEDNSKK